MGQQHLRLTQIVETLVIPLGKQHADYTGTNDVQVLGKPPRLVKRHGVANNYNLRRAAESGGNSVVVVRSAYNAKTGGSQHCVPHGQPYRIEADRQDGSRHRRARGKIAGHPSIFSLWRDRA